MEPRINSSNKFIFKVMTQAIKSLDSSHIQQLSSDQRELVVKIFKNTDNILTNYSFEKDHELTRELSEIHLKLQGALPSRDESKTASLARGAKTFFGARVSSETLKAEIRNPNSPARSILYLNVAEVIPTHLQDPSFDFLHLPQETQKILNDLLWTHLDNDSHEFHSAHQVFSEHLNTLPQDSTAGYLKAISQYLYREHTQLDFQTAIPEVLFNKSLLVDLSKTSPETKSLINHMMWAHFDLQKQRLPADTSINDPIFLPLQESYMALTQALADSPSLLALTSYTYLLHIPNSQRPFLAFSSTTGGQESRLESVKESLKDNIWAQEGYVRPILALPNLWERTTLESTGSDTYSMKISTRVDTEGHPNVEMEKNIEIPISLIPFRKGNTPLTAEQKEKLFQFLKKDTPYNDPKPALEKLDFLTPEQKMLLVNTHTELYNAVNQALITVYTR